MDMTFSHVKALRSQITCVTKVSQFSISYFIISSFFLIGLPICFLLSCTRFSNTPPASFTFYEAHPAAILQTGENPLWFQLTENGPVHLESIEDAVYSAALIPWTLALHICFFHEKEDELVIVVNRDGFIKLAPYDGTVKGLAMYRFSGGELWRQYTAGGFVYYENKPAVLLYLDDRFLDSDTPLPHSAIWTFNMESNTPFPLEIPALIPFPAKDGWSVDTLRLGHDGLFYYRVSNKNYPQPRMFRTLDLARPGEDISAEVFFNSVPVKTVINNPSLPPLPENFVYTEVGRAGDSLFVSWEEQVDYNIGAAGFMVIKID
jgi:hypothetical protein